MFESEKQLVDEVLDFLQFSTSSQLNMGLGDEHQFLLQEVDLGYGIADIVVTYTSKVTEDRDIFLNPLEVRLLKIITRVPGITKEHISEKTKLSNRKVLHFIKKLIELNLVQIKDDKIYPRNEYVRTVTKSIAIEAKLKNWQRALKQAYRYKWFSHKAFVCLPIESINPALKNIEKFKKMGVGLLGFSGNNGLKVFYNHESEEPISDEMVILLNERVLDTMHAF